MTVTARKKKMKTPSATPLTPSFIGAHLPFAWRSAAGALVTLPELVRDHRSARSEMGTHSIWYQ